MSENKLAIHYAIAKPTDFDGFYELFRQSLATQFPGYSSDSLRYILEWDYDKAWMKKAIKNKDKFAYIATVGGRVVGYVFAGKAHVGVSLGIWVAVDPSHQRRGIAKNLLHLWEQHVVEQGGHAAHLWTTQSNLAFYTKLGFVLSGEFPAAWYGHDMYMFYKLLAEPKEANYLRKFLQEEHGE